MGYAAAPRVAFIVYGIQTFLMLNNNNYNNNNNNNNNNNIIIIIIIIINNFTKVKSTSTLLN